MHAGAARSPMGRSALGMQASRPRRLGRRTGKPGPSRRLRPGRSRAVEPQLLGRARASPWHIAPSRKEEGAAGGSGRRQACAHAGAHRSHRTMTRQDLPGRDRVYPERLQQLRARWGRLSPHSDHHHSSRQWTSGYRRRPSYPQSRRNLLLRAGRRGRRHRARPIDPEAPASPGPARARGVLSRCSTTGQRRRPLIRSTPPLKTWRRRGTLA